MLPKFVDIGAGAEKLLAFKRQLKNAHVVSAFSSPEDLAAKVTQDVVRLVGAMDKAPGAQVLPQLAATATRMHRLTPPRFAFLKGRVAGAFTQDVPDSVLHESLGFLLGGDNMAAVFTLSRGTPMSLDDAIDSLMRIEKILMELVKGAQAAREGDTP